MFQRYDQWVFFEDRLQKPNRNYYNPLSEGNMRLCSFQCDYFKDLDVKMMSSMCCSVAHSFLFHVTGFSADM